MQDENAPIEVPEALGLEEGHAIKLLYPGLLDEAPLEMLVCRVGGRLYAMNSLCPHEGGRMAEGPLMDGRTVHCPLHLYRFEPGSGCAVEVDCPPVETYPISEEAGRILVWPYSGR